MTCYMFLGSEWDEYRCGGAVLCPPWAGRLSFSLDRLPPTQQAQFLMLATLMGKLKHLNLSKHFISDINNTKNT